MRIAFVVNQFPPYITSGLGRYIEEITPHLAGPHELTVYTLHDGSLPTREQRGPLTIHRPVTRVLDAIGRRRRQRGRLNRTRRAEFLLLTAKVLVSNLRYVRRLRRAGRDQRPDLVAVHDSTNFLCGLLCHYLLRLPVVFHIHTTEYGIAPQRDITDPLGMFAALERWLGRIARRVVVATPEIRDQLVAAGWDREKIDVVVLGGSFERVLADPGFDRERLRAGAAGLRSRLGIGGGDQVLLFVGRLERQKGVYPLLAALPRIAAALPRLRLVLAGEGDLAGVRRIAADAGLAGRVHATGEFVTGMELLAHYELADACVFPSLFEPFGLVATEAMAMARPAILGSGFSRFFAGDPDRPAVRFVGGTGPDAIADAVIEVMGSPERRETLGARGERFVRERLSWSRTAEQTLAVYRAALADPAPAREPR